MVVDSGKLLIGAHTSAAGGVFNALLEGQRIGATTIQLFTSNQRQWAGRALEQATIDKWKETLEQTGLRDIMSHDSYLINLGAPDPVNLVKSRKAFREEVERCVQLGITYLNFHPGAHIGDTPDQCLDRICESILEVQDLVESNPLRLLLETTAGQGSCVGDQFDQLGYIISRVKDKVKIGVCVDTCHIFAAGYDIRTPEACDATLKLFDKAVGLSYLYAFHMNDSKGGLGSYLDRHLHLGKGLIGIECFKFLMQDPRTRDIPKYLETPEGPEVWKTEIQMLRDFASNK